MEKHYGATIEAIHDEYGDHLLVNGNELTFGISIQDLEEATSKMKLSDNAQAALDKVVAQFKAGDISPIVEIARIQPQGGGMPSEKWSLSNRVLAYMQSGTLDCRGFRQWESVGRHVKMGTRAAFILAPILVPMELEDGRQVQVLRGFRSVAVFAVHDTEGQNVPKVDYEPRELPPLADVAKRLGVRVDYIPLPVGKLGSCATDGSHIRLGTHDVETFFHELAHAAHARLEGKLKGGQDTRQETIAEFVGAVLMQLYGLGDRSGNAWNYIKLYSDDPIQAIVRALSTVEKVLALLLDENVAPQRSIQEGGNDEGQGD